MSSHLGRCRLSGRIDSYRGLDGPFGMRAPSIGVLGQQHRDRQSHKEFKGRTNPAGLPFIGWLWRLLASSALSSLVQFIGEPAIETKGRPKLLSSLIVGERPLAKDFEVVAGSDFSATLFERKVSG